MCQNPLVRTPQYGNFVIEEATKRAQRGVRLHIVPGNAKAPRAEHRRTTMCDERGTIPTQLGEATDPVVLVSERIKEDLRPQLERLRKNRSRSLQLEARYLVRKRGH